MNIISCEDYTPTSQSTTRIFVYSDSQIHVKTDISCLPVYTWHVHPATQDMFVQSCMTCLTSHTGHICSVMHDMFDQPHRTCLFSHAWHVWPATQDMFVQSCMTCLTSHTWRVRSVMHDSTDGVQKFDLPGRSRRRWRRRSMGWQGRLHTQTWTDWKSLCHTNVRSCMTTWSVASFLLLHTYTYDSQLITEHKLYPHLQQTEGNRYHLYTVLVLHPYPFKEVSFCHTRMTTT